MPVNQIIHFFSARNMRARCGQLVSNPPQKIADRLPEEKRREEKRREYE